MVNSDLKEISDAKRPTEEVVDDFLKQIKATKISKETFGYKGEKWFIDYHPYDHSDDIIIHEDIIEKHDKFLLVKTGAAQTRIVGWCTQDQLKSKSKRDIYRNGKYYYMVFDTNLKDLSSFKLQSNKKLKTDFVINKQTAKNLGYKEMIDGILAGLHSYAKQAGIFFKDINQKDECILGDKKIKVYTRDAHSDEDMLIYETYYKAHPEIDVYMCCKIKGGDYNYVGYVEKSVVDNTRIVQMIGSGSDKESGDIRRIFAEQYKPISNLIKIYEEEKEEEKITEQGWVPLHMHTEFSVGDGYGTIDYVVQSLKKKGFKGAAITDHGTLGGVWAFQKAMLEQGLKPIVGCELYVTIPESEKRMHNVVLVKNETGWKNLLKLQDIACREDFYYKPIVKIENLFKYGEGLIVLGGCIDSPINQAIKNEDFELAEKYILKYKAKWGDDFYGEIQPHIALDYNQDVMRWAHLCYFKHGVKSVFTTDSHYPYRGDKKFHEAVKSIGFRKKYGEAGFGDDCFFLLTDEEIDRRVIGIEDNRWMSELIPLWKENTLEILDKVDFEIKPPKETDTLPKFLPTSEERKKALKKLCIEGLGKFTEYKYEGKVKEKLDLEVDRILKKDYENYFLIVWDLIRWAKDNGILVGPGRGSVGASLAAYALNITTCDPIKNDLLFDRFMSDIRRDMPDVDMDFQDNRRQEVFKYLIDKYGEKHCAKVATYARFHAKGMMRDVGRIFKIPIKEVEEICALVIIRSGGDARASFSLEDTFAEYEKAKEFKKKYPEAVEIACALEGHIRHKGIHAAAMVVTEKEINNYAPTGKVSGEIVVEWEKQLAEDMKLNKLDILGLKTLSVINDCVKEIGTTLPNIFNDKQVYEKIFSKGETLGVFQFETVGLSKLSKQLKISNFSTLHDATTLFRPGALHCLSKDSFVETARGPICFSKLNRQDRIKCYVRAGKGSGYLFQHPIKFGKTGRKKVFEIKTKGGTIKASAEHRFLTRRGYVKTKDLTSSDEILMAISSSSTKFKKKQVPWNKGLKGFLSEERLGENNPNFKHGLSYGSVYKQTREAIKLKRCKLCRANKNLQVHHKDKNRKNNKKENLEVYCRSCHTKIHSLEKKRDKKGRWSKSNTQK